MKRRAFTTYGTTPIKNIKTPIRNINFATGEDEDITMLNENTSVATTDETFMMLERIYGILLIMVIVQVIKIFIKK